MLCSYRLMQGQKLSRTSADVTVHGFSSDRLSDCLGVRVALHNPTVIGSPRAAPHLTVLRGMGAPPPPTVFLTCFCVCLAAWPTFWPAPLTVCWAVLPALAIIRVLPFCSKRSRFDRWLCV